jgi:hypothetical protein
MKTGFKSENKTLLMPEVTVNNKLKLLEIFFIDMNRDLNFCTVVKLH